MADIKINFDKIRKAFESDLDKIKEIEERIRHTIGQLDAFKAISEAVEQLAGSVTGKATRKAAAAKKAPAAKPARRKPGRPKKAVAAKPAAKKPGRPKKATAASKAAAKPAAKKPGRPRKTAAPRAVAAKKAAPAKKRKASVKRPGAPKGQIRSPRVRAMIEVLKANGGPMKPTQVEAALQAQKVDVAKGTVAATLARLPQVDKVGRGLYQYKG